MKSNDLTRKQAELRAKTISDIKYKIKLELDKDSNTYNGKTKIYFHYNKKTNDALVLDFITESVSEIYLNNKKLKNYKKDEYWLYIDSSILNNGKNKLEIIYTNKYDNTGSGFHKFIDPEDNEIYIHTDFEPYDAHRLFPCFDQPDLKAYYQLNVIGPASWEYIHNSTVKSEAVNRSKKSISFNETAKFSTYLFALVVGPHVKWEDMYNDIPLKLYCRKSLAKYLDPKNIFDITKESFKFLEAYFNIPYPYVKYDQVFVPEFNFGAMENVGCVTFTEHYIFQSRKLYVDYLNRANTIFHEMVHMWFGNLVTMKWWNDLWLNESFADYISYYAMSKGKLFSDSLEYFYSRKDWAYMQDQLSTTHPIVGSAEDTKDAFANFDGISYAKGASVLKQMILYVGEKNFRDGIRAYLKKYYEKNTILDDFLSCMSKSSGKNIVSWSKQWLETTGVNTMQAQLNHNTCTVQQFPSQNNNLIRDHAILYESYILKNQKPKSIFEDKIYIIEEKTQFKLASESNFLLLNSKDHDYVKVYFNSEDIKFIKKHVSSIEDRFARRIVWGNLWQMVRDNQFSPITYLKMIKEHLILEKDITVCQSQLISKAVSTISLFLNDENRNLWKDEFFKQSLKILKMGGNTEKQLTWFNMILFSSNDIHSLNVIKNILEGGIIFENLKIDQAKRWRIINKLSSYNYKNTKELIKQEEIADRSSLGRKNAYMAKISIPNTKSKSYYWNDFSKNQNNLSTDFIRTGMTGFLQNNQKEILKPYINLYFDNLKRIYETKDLHYSSAYGEILFPSIFDPAVILEKTETYIANTSDLPKLCLKQLIEHCDNLKRRIPILKPQ